MADTDGAQRKGRGWFGDSLGHARAGRIGGQKSGGNFKRNRKKASEYGKRKSRLLQAAEESSPAVATSVSQVAA